MQGNENIIFEPPDELIERLRNEAIKKVAPNMLPNDDANWQQRKSAQTRTLLLNATMECLAEYGYSDTTTQLVTKTAKVSRGAMLHHFSTKQHLIEHVIEYTFYRRIMAFYNDILPLSQQENINEFTGIELYWQGINRTEYAAYQELAMASRTDIELRKIFEPQDVTYQKIWEDQLPFLYPGWVGKLDEFQLARDLIESSMLGLLTNFHLIQPRSRRTRFRKLVAIIVGQLMRGELTSPEVTKAEIAKTD